MTNADARGADSRAIGGRETGESPGARAAQDRRRSVCEARFTAACFLRRRRRGPQNGRVRVAISRRRNDARQDRLFSGLGRNRALSSPPTTTPFRARSDTDLHGSAACSGALSGLPTYLVVQSRGFDAPGSRQVVLPRGNLPLTIG